MNSNNKLQAKIISPKTGRYITINSDAYKRLLNDGYTEEELLKKIVGNKLLPVPKFPNTIKNNKYYKIGLTGEVDTDKYLIHQLDLKDLFRFYRTDKYIKNLIDNDDKLQKLIILLKNSSIYDPDIHSINFKQNVYSRDNITKIPTVSHTAIIDYTLKLLEDRQIDEAMKIVDFYEPINKSHIDNYNVYDEYFYGRLFYEIIESNLLDLPYIFEDYFSIAPNDIQWDFLEDALESPLGNWDIKDIFNLVIKLLKSAEITRKNKLFNQIVAVWNLWKDSIEEVMIEENDIEDLKLFNVIIKLINNHH